MAAAGAREQRLFRAGRARSTARVEATPETRAGGWPSGQPPARDRRSTRVADGSDSAAHRMSRMPALLSVSVSTAAR